VVVTNRFFFFGGGGLLLAPAVWRGSVVVRVQMLAELEEIIRYKQLQGQPDAQQFLRMTWNKRYAGRAAHAGAGRTIAHVVHSPRRFSGDAAACSG